MHRLAFVALLLASAAPAMAEEPKRSLTIYNSDLALVEEVRDLNLPAGRSKLEFKDVSAAIRPETVALTGGELSIVEQNFDYDLLTPAKLMEKAVGREVQIVRTNPGTGQQTTERATVLSVNNGVVLKVGDHIEVLRDDGVPTRVIFDKVPENLRARPTLSVTVDAEKAGPRKATLSYLSRGLSWKADYVALFDEKAGKLDLQGWITLTNQSGTDFKDVDAQLVAGDVNLVSNPGMPDWQWQQEQQRRRSGQSAGGAEIGAKAAMADYYLYPLPERTTVANNQTKQVGFLDVSGVAARKVYAYRASWFTSSTEPLSADVVLQFSNSTRGGLGAQLPAGVMRVYMRDQAGEPKFVGENRVDHTAQGSNLTVKTGEAFDVTVQPTLVSQRKVSWSRSTYEMSYLVRNARSEPVTVEIVQAGLWRDGKVLKESQTSRRVDARSLAWDVAVPAGGETTLTFTVDNGW
ncbi:DUF4139 domain-containing protein [Caulobacter sp. 17J80-11]|uniref:DUF4139 domain-containing protein n=1 Tax=Caulobacter sp. 17J80-11 TaxID=2763502 RepID=UPI001653CC13|nr:DUF4139 domain-containing protein [Caulobacter sp. 17J80-11]MBC6982241.1 DUF4139 domain-containing protein [Caulobacter sp. 17J80-11]